MSGIAGLYRLDGRPIEPSVLRAMVDTMPHRGPDGAGVWTAEAVGFGHRMLHTTPESLGEVLPYAEGTLAITADARLDNREALLDLLRPPEGSEIPDSRLILRAYRRWGEACVEHLLGDFAFAIWDGANRRLFCARDPLGIKPFFYWHRPEVGFAFASEIKALTALSDVPEELNEEAVACYVARQLLDAEQTAFVGIRRLLGGHVLSASPAGLRVRRYWEPGPMSGPVPTGDVACAEAFAERFTEAVRCRLRSAFPVGSELSGGLDSSYVACVARDLLAAEGRIPLPTVSTVYDRFPECDERTYIEAVVAQGGIEPHYIAADAQSIFKLLDDIYTYLDDGRAGGNHHLNWLTTVAAREAGLRVLLTGQDGDTTIGHGYSYFTELAREGRWDEFAREARLGAEQFRSQQGAYSMQEGLFDPRHFVSAYGIPVLKEAAIRSDYRRFWQGVTALKRHFGIRRRRVYGWLWRDLLRPPWMAHARQARGHAAAARAAVPKILNPDLVRRVGIEERLVEHRQARAEPRSERERQAWLLRSPYLAYSVEKIDLYAAANGLEARHPFMDTRLIALCLALPTSQSFNQGWSRVVMRRAMEGVVPPEVQWRVGKTHLGPPYRHVYLEKAPDRLEALMRDLDVAAPYLDVDYVRALYARREELSDDEVPSLGLAIGLGYWLRRRASGAGASAEASGVSRKMPAG